MAFVKGQSGNAGGRPKGTGRPVSRLRQLESKLKLLSDQSLILIAQELDYGSGKEGVMPVDKEVLSTAKWTVTTYTAVRKAAEAEELAKTPAATTAEVPGYVEQPKSNFTLKMVNN